MQCGFTGCDGKAIAKGFCKGHYSQHWRGNGMAPLHVKNAGRVCLHDGCENPANARGLCKGHYAQRKRGEPLRTLHAGRTSMNRVVDLGDHVGLVLTNRRGVEIGICLIDRDDLDGILAAGIRLYMDPGGYVRQGPAPLHRLLLGCPDGMQGDHINGVRTDNRRVNLRIVTPAENMQNVARVGRERLRNVYYHRTRGTWRVSIDRGGHRVDVGEFHSEAEAIEAAREARKRHHTHANEERHQ